MKTMIMFGMIPTGFAQATVDNALFIDDGRGVGNPAARPVVVEFMDYACHFCKMAHAEIPEILKIRPNLFVVRRDLPLLGSDSFTAAAAVMAAGIQGKSLLMHDIIMKQPRLNIDVIISAARSSGTDTDKMSETMSSVDFQTRFMQTINVSRSLNLAGTPSYLGRSGKILEGFGNKVRFTSFVDSEENK